MKVTAIYHYPIESCGAVALEAAELDDSGVPNDRRFMLVAPNGRFLSQARHPRLVLAQPKLHGDVLEVIASEMEPLSLSTGQRADSVRIASQETGETKRQTNSRCGINATS